LAASFADRNIDIQDIFPLAGDPISAKSSSLDRDGRFVFREVAMRSIHEETDEICSVLADHDVARVNIADQTGQSGSLDLESGFPRDEFFIDTLGVTGHRRREPSPRRQMDDMEMIELLVALATVAWVARVAFSSVRAIRRVGLRRFGMAVGHLGWDLGKVALGGTALAGGAMVASAAGRADDDDVDSGLLGPDLMDMNDPPNFYDRWDFPLYIAEDLDKKEGGV